MGLLRRGEEEEFVVAQLEVYKRSCSMVFADIYFFLKSAGKWGNLRLPILCGGNNNPKDIWQVCLWETDTVIPAGRYLCWVDYERGILLYDVFGEPTPTVFFRKFPLDKFPDTQTRSKACRWLYRSVSAIDDGNVLMFIDVARDDDIGYGALKPGAGFTITCHTLKLGSSSSTVREWEKEYTVTSNELWSANPESLPNDILMFPQVDINMPHVVHFLISEFGYVRKKMWLVTIDMNTKSMRNFSQYTHGRDAVLGTEAAYLTNVRSSCPMPFLPCELPKYLFEGAEYIE